MAENETRNSNEVVVATGVRRLVRRGLLEKVGANLKGEELRKVVREKEQMLELPRQIEALIRSEFAVDEKRSLLADRLAVEISSHFKIKGFAVILLGSSVHGGVATRELMGNPQTGDLDWGILFDEGGVDVGLRHKIKIYGEAKLRELSTKYFIDPPLFGCTYANPEREWASNLNGSDIVFSSLEKHPYLGYADQKILYFFPSFPKEVNERNRRLMLEGLTQLAKKNRQKWIDVTESFIFSWRYIHRLREKHLLDFDRDYRKRDRELATQIANASESITGRRMEEVILATGKV